jgi:predicted MFS family arabinose efflux permease
MRQADAARMVFLATLPLVVWAGYTPSLIHVFVVAVVMGTGNTLFESAAHPFLADLVPRSAVVTSNARMSFTEGISIIAGPAIAGVLIATMGASGALTVDSLTFGLSIVCLLMIRPVSESLSNRSESVSESLRAGVRALREHDQVRSLTYVLATASLGAGAITGLSVIFMQRTLGLSGSAAGTVFAINGIGAIGASIIAQRLSLSIGLGRTILCGLAVASVGFVLFSSATSAHWLLTAGGGMGLIGLGIVVVFIASTSLRQRVIAGEVLGRVTATYRVLVNGALAVGAVGGGLVAQIAGIRPALVSAAGVYAVGAASAFFTSLNGPDGPDGPDGPGASGASAVF